MKKLAIILAFLMLVPGAAFGLEMMNDNAMDDVTGQAGVSIAFDDVQLFLNIERLAWIDADGFASNDGFGGESGSAGAVGIDNFQLDTLRVNAITGTQNGDETDLTSIGQFDTQFDYGDTAPLGGAELATGSGSGTVGLDNYEAASGGQMRALTIDATSELPALSAGKQHNVGDTAGTVDIGGVLIGIPTMEISIPSMKMTPVFFDVDGVANSAANAYETGSISPDATYGTILMDGVTFTTLSGWIEIAPH